MSARTKMVNSQENEYEPIVNMEEPDRRRSPRSNPSSAAHDLSVRLGAAKLLSLLRGRDKGCLEVEADSVYGAALAVPQIARSCGWTWELVGLCARNYFCLALNVVLQGYILYLINAEELIFDKFSGQMYMCNMGANLRQCPDAAGCVGPSGTRYTPERLYNFQSWVNRNFVRDSMAAIFPEKKNDIYEQIDPGEFGVESSECRWVCTFLFVLTLMEELTGVVSVARVLLLVPTQAEPWVYYEVPQWADKKHVKAVHSWTELDLVKIEVAGMPLHWKLVNWVFVFLPKVTLWLMTLLAGTTFLMETSGIDSIIVNSTALGFILSIDEVLFSSLSNPMGLHMMERLEARPLYDLSEEDEAEDEHVVRRHTESRSGILDCVLTMIPLKLVVVIGVWSFAMANYYLSNCEQSADGTWVSKRLYLPQTITLTVLQAFAPRWFPIDESKDPVWSMPAEEEQ